MNKQLSIKVSDVDEKSNHSGSEVSEHQSSLLGPVKNPDSKSPKSNSSNR